MCEKREWNLRGGSGGTPPAFFGCLFCESELIDIRVEQTVISQQFYYLFLVTEYIQVGQMW